MSQSNHFSDLLSRARQWDVSVERTLETTGSLLAFGTRRGADVVLKVTKKRGDEWHAGDVLRAFAGEGVVKVYESEGGAVLLERLMPGNQLVELVRQDKDDDATRILAGLMRRMSDHDPPAQSPTVLDWARGFDRYLETADNLLPNDLVLEARDLYLGLADSQKRTMLLHGDLQHYNVIFDSNHGWVSIDPKGVVGELEYEVGAILRNPVELPDFLISPKVIERRLKILTKEVRLDYGRALEWSFAQAVLSAIWDVEDELTVSLDHHTLKLAESIRIFVR